MLVLLCDWFEKLTDYIFGLDSSAFVQSPLLCFYYFWYLIHNRWHIFFQNAASVPTGNRGAPDIIRLLPTISVLESKGGKFAAFSKNWLFLLQLLALSPRVGLYFTKAVSHGYLCRAPFSVIVVTRQRKYRGKGKV